MLPRLLAGMMAPVHVDFLLANPSLPHFHHFIVIEKVMKNNGTMQIKPEGNQSKLWKKLPYTAMKI